MVLIAVLCVPWYWLAELKTPGFLDYFLVGEHWKPWKVDDQIFRFSSRQFCCRSTQEIALTEIAMIIDQKL
jgi:hypothetical protein